MKTELSDYVRRVTSRPILEEVAAELGWIKEEMNAEKRDSITTWIMDNVEAVELKKGKMIRLYYKSKDPQEAAHVVNTIFEIFKKANIEERNIQIRKVRMFVEKALNDVSGKLKQQEERLRELTTAGTIGTGSSIIEDINALEKLRSTLSTQFTERHPEIVSLNDEITALKTKLKNLPKEEFEYRILERDINIDETLYNDLKERLQEVQIKEVEEIDNVIMVDPAKPPTWIYYPDAKKNYFIAVVLGLGLGVALAFVAEQLDTSIRKIDDIEGFLKASVLGIIPYCSDKDKEKAKARKKWRSFFRKEGRGKVKVEPLDVLALDESTDQRFIEAFRILSVNLQMRFGEAGGRLKSKIIMFTSSSPKDGKSLITSNLSVIMSQMGYKVLLLDTDTRRPMVHKNFGLKNSKNGLTDILMGAVELEGGTKTATDIMLALSDADKIMNKSWLNNLHIITAGSSFPNPANLFNSDKMNDILDQMRGKYDIIIVDSPPILTVSEPSIMCPKVDEVILIFRAGFTSRLILKRARQQIEGTRGKGSLSGIIVNNANAESGRYGYYGYDKYYGKYDHYYAKSPSDLKRGEES
ncbi:MAG: polysaccharide biosynthesis tyrosine autokinase [Candidatus Omnitrophica bacterium]|nr:polysaccharide biosynthesis tyrosine autokinase [Candidatus Omnitrophota bacterium]